MIKVPETIQFQELLTIVNQLENGNGNQQLTSETNHLKSKTNQFEQLKSVAGQLEADYKQLDSKNQQLESKNLQLENEKKHLQFHIDQLKRLLFGSKRERFIANKQIDGQMNLPFEVEQQEEHEQEQETESVNYTRKKRQNHPGRAALPDHLPVEEIILQPEEDISGLIRIGTEITDKLEIKPAKLYIKRYIRFKYIAPEDEHKLDCKGIIAALPDFPIEKAIAGASLLAQILIDKYVDHLPVYRQVQRFARENVRIPANTIDGWQDKVSKLLFPLHQRLKQLVRGQGYLQVDETPIRVLDKKLKEKCHRGYYWVYNSPLQDAVFFDYQKGRGRDGPKKLLGKFRGYIQSDGYSVYDWFGEQENTTLVNCWAHARRYFIKALKNDKKSAEHALKKIQLLYMIERFARTANYNASERKQHRLEYALPILNELGKWMAEKYKYATPKSPIGKALNYTIARWDNLMAYLYDGHLEIDNNLVENAIRPNALGRKNYLFAGSHAGAERAAMFYSFFGTCKKHNINPFDWLNNVLERIPMHKANKLDELLPQNWQKLKGTTPPE